MKKLLPASSLILISILVLGCDININTKDNSIALPAEGKTFDIKPFNAIRIEGVFNVVLSQGSKESAVVKGSMPATLKIATESGVLIIADTSKGINIGNHSGKTTIYLTLADINSIENSSVGEITCSDTLKLKKLTIHSEGVGATELWLNADTVKVSEEGVGKLTITGKAQYSELEDAGVGALNTKKFNVEVLHVNVSGVGEAKVYASHEIYMDVSGVGGVEYNGPAKVMQNESSGVGKVVHGE